MTQAPLILVCDHRGEGLADTVRPLSSAGFCVEVSPSLGTTREALLGPRAEVVVIEPLTRGGAAELDLLRRVLGEDPPPVLVVADPDEPVSAVLAARTLGEGLWDVVRRGR